MNVFCLDNDPVKAAQLMCDKHLPKMIVESAQMLANCFSLDKLEQSAPRSQKGNARKHSYYNHPCSKWVRASKANYDWLVTHALTLCRERTYRNPDCRKHFTEEFIWWCSDHTPDNMDYRNNNPTPFAIAISPDTNCRKVVDNFENLDTIKKYQMYYKYDKPFAKWTRREIPEFMK